MAAEEEWEVRSVMTSRAETRPAVATRPTYARTESVTDWVVRLAGWGAPIPVAQPDPAKKEKEPAAAAIEEGSPSCALPAQPYDFSNPGGVKAAAQEKSLNVKTGMVLSKAVQSQVGGVVDEGAITPPSQETPTSNKAASDGLPRPCRDIKAELARLKKIQSPYLDMEAFLSSETEQRGVEPWLVLLDGSRARLPTKEFYHASYVDGFAQRRQFLLAQAPSPATLRTFWYMMLCHRVPLIVVSGPEALQGFPFWPGGAEEDLSWEGGDVYVGRLGPVRSGPGYRLLQLRVRVDGQEGGMELMELPWEKEPRVPMELISVAGRILALHAHYMAKAEKKAERLGQDLRKSNKLHRKQKPEGGITSGPPRWPWSAGTGRGGRGRWRPPPSSWSG